MTSAPAPPRASPAFRIAYPPSLAPFHVPLSTYISTHHPSGPYTGAATSALVFDPSNRVLLLRRAAHDSMPGQWEPPGGAADEEDGSLLVAVARELWEEAGLVASRVRRVVSEGAGMAPGSPITNRTGTVKWVKFGFEVEVAPGEEVEIDPNEHDKFVWATEEEVRDAVVGLNESGIGLTFGGTKEILLDAFRRRREEPLEEATGWAVKEAAVEV
ncbi:NUDIX hydrolase domain-like protein [Plectosphaerella cucumerina]|uniref:NUDIX hydrolase domain-like protein n=1 Tax=Plectosphaerella cucumerina TaxID=40658 RepID=A0A8K0T6B4_9PEZI|nr:NUDIX hydrolase domain-like protein [Plectosphaerella cucumerina]